MAARSASRGRQIRAFIIRNIPEHPRDVVNLATRQFGISRQAVNRYIKELVENGVIVAQGATSQRRYSLKKLTSQNFELPLQGLEEDRLWRAKVLSIVEKLPQNAIDIWHYAFMKTVVPVRLGKEGDEKLVSRSQAKRLLARADRFNTAILDFAGVETIGRAFADEIFRVFAQRHRHVLLIAINAADPVEGMITRARAMAARPNRQADSP